MKNAKLSAITLSLISIFSTAAYAENEQQIAGRVALSDDNHAQIAAENVRKINGIESSGSLNVPTDLQINQSYDLKNNSQFLLPASNQANTVDWQIDNSYALENNHFSGSLNNIFQQDKETVLWAENTVNDTKTDAVSGSLNNEENQDTIAPVAATASSGDATQIEDITVQARRTIKPAERYQNTISRKQIEMKSQGNGDIGSMLRSMPNVQFDNSYRQSTTPGEIEPAKISISGAQPYQNLITVDGLNIVSKIDPAAAGGNQWNSLPGQTQNMNIDVDLLDKITVMDSAISAEYGGFSGGVVETELRRPNVPLGFKISRKYTNGNVDKGFPKSLTKYHIYGDEEDRLAFLNSYDKNKQPEFKKYVTQITPEAILNDNWGVIGSFNLTESIIPLRMHDDTYKDSAWSSPIDPDSSATEKKKQKRQNLNAMLKAYYDPTENLGFELSYIYAPNYSREYLVGSKNGDFYDNKHGGHTLNFKTKWNNDWGKLTNIFGVQQSKDEVEASGYDSVKYWSTSDSKFWSNWASWVREGGTAPSKQDVLTISNKIKQEFKPFKWGNTEHAIKVGGELQYNKAQFGYTRNFLLGVKSSRAMTQAQQELCKKTDMAWCDPALVYDPRNFDEFDDDKVKKMTWFNPIKGENQELQYWPYGQYFKSISSYRADDRIKVNDKQIALFLEDNITLPLGEDKKYGELTVRPGVRWDYNSYVSKHSIAPRLFTDYAFPWSGEDKSFSTHISGGYNRYYGSNFYSYALNDGKNAMSVSVNRNSPDITWDSLLAENRECAPYERQRDPATGKWVYWHYKNGKRVEGQDTNCVEHSKNTTRFDKLKMPYADEFMFGISQDLGPVTTALKYIRRNGRDEVIRAYSDEYGPDGQKRGPLAGYSDTYYTNAGKSTSDIVLLYARNTRPLMLGKVKNNFSLALDWTNTKRNKADYNSYYRGSDYESPFIVYEGELIHQSQKPADNFTKPYTLKLEANHEWQMLGGTWRINNLFNFQSGYKKAVTSTKWDKTGREFGLPQDKVPVYEITRIPSSFTWDAKFGAEYAVYKKNKLFFNVDVFNVTNKRNVTTASVNTNTNSVTETYGTGRQFWFELGYRYY
ncbi:MAG: TonB-dependent receptor plug domain-containing protein [Neisseriaceae bacterium]|nr:TonB-dependent receptor plug domain-containing protein [Neisseriaceae bacterium]